MLHALVMAGGSGTRFWPLSRRRRPKHLLPLGGGSGGAGAGPTPGGSASGPTLVEETVGRLRGAVRPEHIWVVTTVEQADGIRAAVPALAPENVLAEPCGRDTAAALGLGAAAIAARDPEAILVAMPADQVIRPDSRFRACVESAARVAAERPASVVTIGIPPTSPATGFGYIQMGALISESAAPGERWARALPHRVRRAVAFREKPALELAERYLAEGGYVWNAGIFVWRARGLLDALRRFLPETGAALDLYRADGWDDLRERYPLLPKISIDYAVLEKHPEVYVVEADFVWSDVGSFVALPELIGVDADGHTVLDARHVSVGSKDLIVCGDGSGGVVATVGVAGLIVVKTGDAVLVCARDKAQDVKKIVDALAARGLDEVL